MFGTLSGPGGDCDLPHRRPRGIHARPEVQCTVDLIHCSPIRRVSITGNARSATNYLVVFCLGGFRRSGGPLTRLGKIWFLTTRTGPKSIGIEDLGLPECTVRLILTKS